MNYYDWQKTFSYSKAKWVLVISARGYGKTYGIRKQCVRDYIKKGFRFCEIVRHKSEVPIVAKGYFDKLQRQEFPKYSFKYEANQFYIMRSEKKGWELIGYIAALTDEQLVKKITFDKVKRMVFDEAIIEHKDRYKRYLPREFARLVGLRSSITRPIPGQPDKSVVYLLGNAVDYTCPLFEELRIDRIVDYGRHVFSDGDVLLDYVEPIYYDEFKQNTAIGRALDGKESATLFANEFSGASQEYVEPKPKGSKFWRGYVFAGHVYALWIGADDYCYVTGKAPASARLRALSLDDDRVNYDLIKRSGEDWKMLRNLFYYKLMRYENATLRERYADMLISLGIV